MKISTRRQARILVLQALYEWLLSGNTVAKIEKSFVESPGAEKADMDYFRHLFSGTVEHVSEIDQMMIAHISRSLSDISPVELSVLRLAIFELKYRPDVPYRVVINEALELTKKFGAEEGFKFINGVLDKVSRELRIED